MANPMSTHVAIIQKHDTDMRRAVMVPPEQSLDFDPGPGATRRWLWPYLGTEWHLVEFLEIAPNSLSSLTSNSEG